MKTNLEKFSERVAEKTLDIQLDSAELKGIDITSILQLIEMIATIIKSVSDLCPNKARFASVAKNPTWTQRILFRAEVRKSFNESDNWVIRRAHIKAAQNALDEAAKMTDVELQAIVDELELIDNAII